MQDLETVQSVLQYCFTNKEYLTTALTHRSHSASHNERLEFLGDSFLNLIIANALFERFPEAAEGILSRLRSEVVRGESLAKEARRLELGRYVYLGDGEVKSGGRDRDSILADTFEAIVGAIYVDGGFEPARDFVTTRFEDQLADLDPNASLKDPKSRLQEYLQQLSRPLPRYIIVQTTGDPHQQRFIVECAIEGITQRFRGEGPSRRLAEQEAASTAYSHITASG